MQTNLDDRVGLLNLHAKQQLLAISKMSSLLQGGGEEVTVILMR